MLAHGRKSGADRRMVGAIRRMVGASQGQIGAWWGIIWRDVGTRRIQGGKDINKKRTNASGKQRTYKRTKKTTNNSQTHKGDITFSKLVEKSGIWGKTGKNKSI